MFEIPLNASYILSVHSYLQNGFGSCLCSELVMQGKSAARCRQQWLRRLRCNRSWMNLDISCQRSARRVHCTHDVTLTSLWRVLVVTRWSW